MRLDTLALAIMQNLGNWHVFNAMRVAHARISPVSPDVPLDTAVIPNAVPPEANFLPAVDLRNCLKSHQALHDEAGKTPEEFGQRERLEHVCDLAHRLLDLLQPRQRSKARLLLRSRPHRDQGLSILVPPHARTRRSTPKPAPTSVCPPPITSNCNSAAEFTGPPCWVHTG